MYFHRPTIIVRHSGNFIMKLLIHSLILLALAIGCQNHSNSFLKYEHSLSTTIHDSLKLRITRRIHDDGQLFDTLSSFCKYERDSLKVYLSTGWLEGSYRLNLNIFQDSVYSSFSLFDNSTKIHYIPVMYSWTLNSPKPNIDDYLVLQIKYKAIGTPGYKPTYKDTATIEGKIKLKVRNSQFDFKDLLIEYNRNEFYSQLRQRPDTITRLDLYGCSFTQLPDELKFFTNLQELNLEGNDLGKAQLDCLSHFKRLKVLNLQDCNISTFPLPIIQLSQLEDLSVYGNSLSSIPDELYNVSSLRVLSIGNNNLTFLSPMISKLKNLRSLETSHTEIKRYPEELTKLKKLVEIYPNDTMIFIPHSLTKFVWGCDTILAH
jgi:hypothetical protein